MREYDLIVIGGGSGGLTAASGAANMGASVALIDDQPGLGGDCLHFG
ncbi:MAG: FAD-dependent oxidoreductase, partial [Anaerobacillus sp.]